jgi:hypothetical protein
MPDLITKPSVEPMAAKSTTKRAPSKPATQARHESQCSICAHPDRAEIDREFVNWASSIRLAEHYVLARTSLYRHAHATGLFARRQKNVRAALEQIIEKCGDVEPTAQAVVSAVAAYARINSAGQWVERSETIDLNQLFDRMNSNELEAYARDGSLPEWFPVRPGQENNQNAS